MGTRQKEEEGFYKICQKLFRKSFGPLLIQIHTHYTPLCAGIDTDYLSYAPYHTLLMFFEGGRALAKISRWPRLGDHLAAILTPTPLWLFFHPHFCYFDTHLAVYTHPTLAIFSSTFLLLFYFDNRPAHFVDLLL